MVIHEYCPMNWGQFYGFTLVDNVFFVKVVCLPAAKLLYFMMVATVLYGFGVFLRL